MCLGMRTAAASYVVVWCRGSGEAELSLPVNHLAGADVEAEVLFPPRADVGLRWDADSARLLVRPAAPLSACLIALNHQLSNIEGRS